jgi:hypothetical protein
MDKIQRLQAWLKYAKENGASQSDINKIIYELDAAYAMQPSKLPPLHDTDRPGHLHVRPTEGPSNLVAYQGKSRIPRRGFQSHDLITKPLQERQIHPTEGALNGYDRPLRIDPNANPGERIPRLVPLEQQQKPPVGALNGYDRPLRRAHRRHINHDDKTSSLF